jgi:pimeloyl-ACP methyl ester carboxylesterase
MRAPLIACLALACASTRTTSSAADPSRDFDVFSSGVRLPVHSVGGGSPDARTLIALHGGPGFVADYLRVLEPLASRSLRVVIYDQRGSPRVDSQLLRNDPVDPSPYAPAKLSADLLAVMDAIGARRAILLANSWGGLTVQAFAQDHPDRIASLIFVGSVPPTSETLQRGGRSRNERVKQLQATGILPAQLPTREQDCEGSLRARALTMVADPRNPPPELLAFLKRGCPGQKDAGPAYPATGYDYRAALAGLEVPALVMVGDSDPLVVAADETEHALLRARVRRVTLANCGHFPFWEQPESFFSELRAFLRTAGTE